MSHAPRTIWRGCANLGSSGPQTPPPRPRLSQLALAEGLRQISARVTADAKGALKG